MPRGGKRKGAGAPKGNMNALKHGRYSTQFAEVGALLARDPTVRDALLDIGRKLELKRNRANEAAAYLLARLVRRAETAGADGLNLHLPVDDWDSIKEAAAREALRRIRAAGSNPGRSSEKTRNA